MCCTCYWYRTSIEWLVVCLSVFVFVFVFPFFPHLKCRRGINRTEIFLSLSFLFWKSDKFCLHQKQLDVVSGNILNQKKKKQNKIKTAEINTVFRIHTPMSMGIFKFLWRIHMNTACNLMENILLFYLNCLPHTKPSAFWYAVVFQWKFIWIGIPSVYKMLQFFFCAVHFPNKIF